jgi:hypothetical protein
MGIFTRIASDAFDALQTDAGVLLTTFDPLNPYVTPTDAQIVATTTGGINPVCSATYSDFGDDVDNVPKDMMEFKHLDGWNCSMGFTSIKFNASNTVWALGAADQTTLSNGVKKIVPRRNLSQGDFKDLWWVGDKADGGAYAVRLMNALSTGGLNIHTTKNGKGTMQQTITGHVSISAQNVMPMEFYEIPPESAGSTYQVKNLLTHATSTNSATSVTKGASYSATIAAESTYTLDDVVVAMGGVDITDLVYNSSTGAISIASVTGALMISAVATAGA